MSIKFNRSQTFATNGTVTAAGLHNLVDGLDIYQALITDQTSLSAVAPEDSILIADASLTAGDAPRQTTVSNLFDDALTSGTYTNANLTGNLTYGTATGNRTVSTNASITTGTINNATLGTTTGTAATFTNATATGASITNGTIQTLTSSTATITGGTFSGSINSTTGTINNFSTTLAGDLTISQGTATLGTSGVTAGTYGGSSSIPTITVDTKGRVTTASTSALTTGYTGFRNRIINGDMRIDQRNAGASVSVQTTTTYIVDRWSVLASANSKFTVGQNLNSITPPSGFSHYLGASVASSANVTVGSTDQYLLRQGIEGFNGSDLAWGTSSASPVTLSFWVRSSVTGTFSGSLNGGGGGSTYSYPFTYSISSSNTWERKTITISGSQNGTWATDNSLFTWVGFSLGVGSTYSGTASAWSNSYLVGSTGSVKLIETNSATFYITGIQLEAGSTATDFERRPYGTELALCQRYYQIIKTGLGRWASATEAYLSIRLLQEMRSSPSLSPYKQTVSISRMGINGYTTTSFSVTGTMNSNQGGEFLVTTNNVGASAGEFASIYDSTGAISASSEL